MPDTGLSQYYKIITDVYKVFRDGLNQVGKFSYDSPEWNVLCDRFDAIEKNAPKELKEYAANMVAIHVKEVEDRWRK